MRFDQISRKYKKKGNSWDGKKPNPDIRKIEALPAPIRNHYLSAYESEPIRDLKPVLPDFRASALPFCPIVNLKDACGDGNLTEVSEGLNDSFYTSIGTAVHAAWQVGLANGVQGRFLYGNWKCEGCGSTRSKCLRPAFCNCGHLVWTYVELEFKWRGLSGHCDAVTMYPNYGNVIHDLKTSSLTQTDPDSDAVYLPQTKHIHQIETYAVLMWIIYKVRIHYYCINYISREKGDPSYTKIYGPIPFTREMYSARLLTMQRAAAANKALIDFVGNPTPALAEKIIELRPCHSMDEVEAFEATQFKWTCSNRDICSRDRTAKVPLMKQLRADSATWKLYQER